MTKRDFPVSNVEWLMARRAVVASEVAFLKTLLSDIASTPFEQRSARLHSIIRQAAGAFDEIDHIDRLLADWYGVASLVQISEKVIRIRPLPREDRILERLAA